MKVEKISNNQYYFKNQTDMNSKVAQPDGDKLNQPVDSVEIINRHYERLKELYNIESFNELNQEEIEKIFRPIGSISEPTYPPEVIKEFIDKYVIKYREAIGKIINKSV